MLSEKYFTIGTLADPTPPSGSAYDQSTLAYKDNVGGWPVAGEYGGEPTWEIYMAQGFKNDRAVLTGFGGIFSLMGTVTKDLYVCISDTLPSNPNTYTGWKAVGVSHPAGKTPGSSYYIYWTLSTPVTLTPGQQYYIVAMSDEPYVQDPLHGWFWYGTSNAGYSKGTMYRYQGVSPSWASNSSVDMIFWTWTQQTSASCTNPDYPNGEFICGHTEYGQNSSHLYKCVNGTWVDQKFDGNCYYCEYPDGTTGDVICGNSNYGQQPTHEYECYQGIWWDNGSVSNCLSNTTCSVNFTTCSSSSLKAHFTWANAVNPGGFLAIMGIYNPNDVLKATYKESSSANGSKDLTFTPDMEGEWYAYIIAFSSSTDAEDSDTCDVSSSSTGACCNDTICTIKTQANCIAGGGVYEGDNITCSPNPCGTTPTGACCIDGICTTTTETNCTGAWDEGVPCTPNPCGSSPTGACCIGNVCTPNVTDANCTGIWKQGVACSPNPCGTTPCSGHLDQTSCTTAGCNWYAYPNPFGEPTCHGKSQIEAFLPFIIMGVGGVLLIAALLSSSPSYPMMHPQYPPQQRY